MKNRVPVRGAVRSYSIKNLFFKKQAPVKRWSS